ncbi:uncharacterized protein LOC128672560 isoform X2 [Plodia interpunctella]|uniref:uncharacterized protein LOC128672560 isoform X2 n=1 Tax=Plodia interpunctella TaxID=58824 RepID=UPI00236775C3|nr:uncharacterized protein LOC128672560 isoform X2 [Plodia interpunctella]
MEDEIEDLVGDVKYTDSQKSVTTSNVYSLDFTDSSSDKTDKHNSSGKETYVIDCDSDDSEKTFPLLNFKPTRTSIIPSTQIKHVEQTLNTSPQIKHDSYAQYDSVININKGTAPSFHSCSYVAQETFTQTSKTIIELAALDNTLKSSTHKTLETQTSFLSITENRTFEYKIELAERRNDFNHNAQFNTEQISTQDYYKITGNPLLNNSLDDGSSKFPISQTESTKTDDKSESSSNSEMLNIINDDSAECFSSDERTESKIFKDSPDLDLNSDSEEDSIEDDSLMDKYERRHEDRDSISDVTSLCNDVDDLYKKLSQTVDRSPDRTCNSNSMDLVRPTGLLSPLTEESTKKTSSVLLDVTPNDSIVPDKKREVLYKEPETGDFKLPPIINTLDADCPHIKYTLTINPSLANKVAALKCLYEGQDRWEITSKELAAGESMLINGRDVEIEEKEMEDTIHLPPIEGQFRNTIHNTSETSLVTCKNDQSITNSTASISIKKRIKELKMSNNEGSPIRSNKSRSGSPGSVSPNESRLGDLADRGSETLCVELLRRLRSSSWMEAAETLKEIPTVLEKYWGVISETRIADLIRQVNSLVESPRTQVSRLACTTLAALIKNTNYTKKPDFYEAVTTLLIKTGSFSRPVRTAANLALDEIVSDLDLTHCVTALCLHGAGHKSGLVRGAAARLLVVGCALAEGGRGLLRARPPSAATARRLALSSLAALLTDKNTEVRKYAERLYTMLRPLTNFEAYYLTDVDVEVATRQMKKYDQVLCAKQSR